MNNIYLNIFIALDDGKEFKNSKNRKMPDSYDTFKRKWYLESGNSNPFISHPTITLLQGYKINH